VIYLNILKQFLNLRVFFSLKKVIFFKIGICLFSSNFVLAQESVQKEKKQIEIQFVFDYSYVSSLRFRLFEASSRAKMLSGRIFQVKSFNQIPIQRELTDFKLQVYEGESKNFIFLLENDSASPAFFYSSPHFWDRMLETVGLVFKGLGNAKLNKVESKEIWYRVGSVTIEKNSNAKKLKVFHKIVILKPYEVREFF
jgi:hypothetical protein